VRHALSAHPDWHVTTLETCAGRMKTLHDVIDHPRHTLRGDITDAAAVEALMSGAHILVHFAAETHVDRSISAADEFIRTDVLGTFVLLEAARRARTLQRFIQISTDEVWLSMRRRAIIRRIADSLRGSAILCWVTEDGLGLFLTSQRGWIFRRRSRSLFFRAESGCSEFRGTSTPCSLNWPGRRA
jgi:hypothetical protein